MRSQATLTHTPESCPGPRRGPPVAHRPARAAEMGIDFISAVQRQMSHSQYFVVDTDEYARLYKSFMPFQGISTAEFTPVRDLMAL